MSDDVKKVTKEEVDKEIYKNFKEVQSGKTEFRINMAKKRLEVLEKIRDIQGLKYGCIWCKTIKPWCKKYLPFKWMVSLCLFLVSLFK